MAGKEIAFKSEFTFPVSRDAKRSVLPDNTFPLLSFAPHALILKRSDS